MKKLGYVPALDGLRAIAIGLVLLFHLKYIYFGKLGQGGWLGVDVFFALSGFLITVLLLQEYDEQGSIHLLRFYIRRAFRLFPALAVLLLVYVVFMRVTGQSMPNIWAVVTYHINIAAAEGKHLPPQIAQTWSLAMEEQFYLIWPLLLLILASLRLRRNGFLVVTGVLILASCLWTIHLELAGVPTIRMYYGPDTRADSILLGCFAGGLYHWDVTARFRRALRLASVPFFGILAVAAAVGFKERNVYLWLTLLDACCAAIVLAVASHDVPAWIRKPLEMPAVVYLGKISYSLYLWHQPMLFLFTPSLAKHRSALVVLLLLAIGVAAMSYRFVEQPMLRLRKRLFEGGRRSKGVPLREA